MKTKTISFTTFLLAVCVLFVQTACQAYTIPGWVNLGGAFTQNGGSIQCSINVYDYGAYLANGLYFNGAAGLVKSNPTHIVYTMAPGATVCNDITLTGTGAISKGGVVISGQIWVHLWRGVVNGVNGNWCEAQLSSNDATPVLLWATGSSWPATGSSPVYMGFTIRLPK